MFKESKTLRALMVAGAGTLGSMQATAMSFTPPSLVVTVNGESKAVQGIEIALRNAPSKNLNGLAHAVSRINKEVTLKDVLFKIPEQSIFFKNGASADVGAMIWDPDPSLVIGMTANAGPGAGPFSFHFVMSQPIVLPGGPITVRNSFSGSVTDGDSFGTGTVDIVPTAPPTGVHDGDGLTEFSVATLSTTGDDTGLFTAGIDIGEAAIGLGDAAFYGGPGITEGPLAGPVAGQTADFMQLDVAFDLSGQNDVFTFNGRFDIVGAPVVPLPAAAWMGLSLLGGLGVTRVIRNRMRQSA